jgi:hypothetical protein
MQPFKEKQCATLDPPNLIAITRVLRSELGFFFTAQEQVSETLKRSKIKRRKIEC